MHYRIGLPLWKSLARRGVPMSLRVRIQRDREAAVWIATSQDLRGLVIEADSTEALMPAIQQGVDDLMREYLKRPPKHRPTAKLELGSDSVFA